LSAFIKCADKIFRGNQ
jgi:hypothetical protein